MGKKTVLFLSPHFPLAFPNFISALRKAGCTALAIGDISFENLCDQLKEDLDGYHEVPCMDDYEAVYRAVAGLIYDYGRIDWVQSHNEHWLNIEALIREDFNIQGGYLPEDLQKYNRKSTMKEIFRQLGLRVARGKIMHSLAEALDFVHNPETGVGYPIVAKPDCGVGSINTFRLNDDCELQDFFEHCFVEHPQEYIFEEFIFGSLVTFDGLADKNSEILYDGMMYFGKGLLQTLQEDGDGVISYTSRKIPPKLVEAGKAMVKAFKIRGHFFHFEFFQTADNDFVVLEANLRLPGGRAIDLYNFSYDSDFFQLWADVVADRHEEVSAWKARFVEHPAPEYYVCYASRRLQKHYCYTNEEIIFSCSECNPCNNSDVQMLSASEVPNYCRDTMGNYAFIFRTKEEEPLKDMIKRIQCKNTTNPCC